MLRFSLGTYPLVVECWLYMLYISVPSYSYCCACIQVFIFYQWYALNDGSVRNQSCHHHRFNNLFNEMEIRFMVPLFFSGFEIWQTHVRYRIPTFTQGALYNPPWGTSDIWKQSRWWVKFCSAHVTYAWWVFEIEGLKLTAQQWTCVWLDSVSSQLITRMPELATPIFGFFSSYKLNNFPLGKYRWYCSCLTN